MEGSDEGSRSSDQFDICRRRHNKCPQDDRTCPISGGVGCDVKTWAAFRSTKVPS